VLYLVYNSTAFLSIYSENQNILFYQLNTAKRNFPLKIPSFVCLICLGTAYFPAIPNVKPLKDSGLAYLLISRQLQRLQKNCSQIWIMHLSNMHIMKWYIWNIFC